MRIFVGLPIGAEVASRIAHAIQSLRRLRGRIRWVPLESYHLTMHFLGEMEREEVDGLLARIQASELTTGVIDADVDGLGTFPEKGRRVRVIHLPLRSGIDACRLLYDQLRVPCRSLQGDSAGDYTPHVTLARVREGDGNEIRAALARTEVTEALRFDRVTVFESTLSPSGSVYHPLLSVPLGTEET